jgi:type I restriction enzyme, S subunit
MSDTIPHGYKMSDIGVIPEDWEVTRLGDLLEFRNGVNADKDNYGKGVPFINVLEVITKSHLYTSDIPGRVSLKKNLVTSFSVHHGDIVFNRTSETQEDLGLASVYLGNDVIVFGGFVIRGRPLKQSIDAIYAGYFLRAPIVRFQITAKGQGAIRANIGQGDLRKVLVPLPTLAEQRAIADALSDVDKQIAALDEAIAKKRDLKQGAMQRLLTGEERLPGFSGAWTETTLAQIGTFKKGRNIPKSALIADGLPCVLYGEIYTRYDNITYQLDSHVPLDIAKNSVAIYHGDILFAGSGETLEDIGKCVAYIGADTAYAGGDLIILTPQECDSVFLGYLLNSAQIQEQKSNLGQGSSVIHIYTSNLSKIVIHLPPLKEQQAIGTVLSDIDEEISALEAQREKTIVLKTGMMQELLTGKTRLL